MPPTTLRDIARASRTFVHKRPRFRPASALIGGIQQLCGSSIGATLRNRIRTIVNLDIVAASAPLIAYNRLCLAYLGDKAHRTDDVFTFIDVICADTSETFDKFALKSRQSAAAMHELYEHGDVDGVSVRRFYIDASTPVLVAQVTAFLHEARSHSCYFYGPSTFFRKPPPSMEPPYIHMDLAHTTIDFEVDYGRGRRERSHFFNFGADIESSKQMLALACFISE